ncbi:hypothetical protein [Sulfurovum sp. NBC37-1]|uniref:hypothetical protein n=1 Tax=Sulfurovum sp. (strain NBC37-1) TaxID=387093 RepID=UPI0001587987|nr:hypothetical protein [Sulfurovum sp. NBC37-1]BAF73246.1 hypothetical protein SUN_2307 [Sulfurovum sp. NBC37-1]
MSGRKYIGVDLGAWYHTQNKTSIAIGVESKGKLKITSIYKEYGSETFYSQSQIQEIFKNTKKKYLNATNWNAHLTPDNKNKYLVDFLLEEAEGNALIAIDSPFSVPSMLEQGNKERSYNYKWDKVYNEISNPYIFDNSARFVFEHTYQKPLAPAGDKIGKMTARMVHIIDNYSNTLKIHKTPTLKKNESVSTIEVFPAATLYLYITYLYKNKKINIQNYLEEFDQIEKELSSTTLISYKNTYWKKKIKDNYSIKKLKNFNKSKQEIIKNLQKSSPCWNKKNEYRMLKLIENDVIFDKDLIKTDDDYDAIICALTAYLIDKNGYEKPDEKDIKKFTNSFIYIPKIK